MSWICGPGWNPSKTAETDVKKRVEFYFDVGSPAAYLAWTQLPALTARAGAELNWRPMLLGGVFKATGNSSPAAVPAKGAYSRRDLMRYAERYQVPLRFNPHFPVNTGADARGHGLPRHLPA
jgi:2-hydroxychromene-2-carboxylate isomerase